MIISEEISEILVVGTFRRLKEVAKTKRRKMEGGLFPHWKDGPWHELDLEENEELFLVSSLPAIPEPPTPHEPMEFLSRSWSLSTSEISKALSEKQNQNQPLLDHKSSPDTLPEPISAPQLVPGKITHSGHCRRMSSTIGKWLHQKQNGNTNTSMKKKDQARIENARVHSALSIAGLASALAAVAAAQDPGGSSCSKLDLAMASATQLLASYCIEMAELAGADHDRVASTVRSAVDIQTPGDLITLTAAAATALRGEAALRERLPKETKRNASISPCDKGTAEFCLEGKLWENHSPCEGDLMQLTEKGVLRWKHVSIYINKKCQVKIKIKSKHVGGAFSKKNKCVVYGVCDKDGAWPYRKEREESDENYYFGLKTGEGLMEFKCKNEIQKQKWVDGIELLLRQVNSVEPNEPSMEFSN
ncbi:VAN3-binding protein-like isoform X1 [Arachis stenosperma]|nr:VAN3-binding protein isoform X1 [Arachis hypogaea]XP_057737249.1 VAN3-binding protein-like isoform X1 [Arachis stenosperma]